MRVILKRPGHSQDRSTQNAAIQISVHGNVAPIDYRGAVLLVTRIDFSGELVSGADLGNYVPADSKQGLQRSVVEFPDLDAAVLSQLAQRQRVIHVRLGERQRIFGRHGGLEQPLVARRQAVPYLFVHTDRDTRPWLVPAGIGEIDPHRIVEAEPGVEPGTGELAPVDRSALE